MTTHPKGPRDPLNPMRNRHDSAVTVSKHRPMAQEELIARDAKRVVDWLGESPLHTVTSEQLRKWRRSQIPAWTDGYWKVVRQYVIDGMSEQVTEAAQDTKARLLALVDRLLPECSAYVTGSGPAGEGTIFLKDPVTGENLKKIEHAAIQGYLKFYAELTGLLAEKHQHVHLHGALKSGDMSEVPEAELLAFINAKPITTEQE